MTIGSSDIVNPFLEATFSVPEEEDRLRTFLVDRFSGFADVINDKQIGVIADGVENFNGMKWWYNSTKITRNGYQTLVYIPSFPNTGTLIITLTSVPTFPIDDIDTSFVVTQVWGSASKPPTVPDNTVNGTGDYFSFYSQGNSKISFTMSNKRIVITTTVDMSAYSGFIIIEYVRSGV